MNQYIIIRKSDLKILCFHEDGEIPELKNIYFSDEGRLLSETELFTLLTNVTGNENYLTDIENIREVLEDIVRQKIDSNTDFILLNNFVYNGVSFYLDLEHQNTYKAVVDRAFQDKMTYPTLIKGIGENGYIQFQSKEELIAFWDASYNFMSEAISQGWNLKDGILGGKALSSYSIEELVNFVDKRI